MSGILRRVRERMAWTLTVAKHSSSRLLERVFQPGLHRQRATAERNTAFLTEHGFNHVEDGDISLIDAEGNPLRLIKTQSTQLVFIVLGKRKHRAYIHLDKKGRYMSYSGLVSLEKISR